MISGTPERLELSEIEYSVLDYLVLAHENSMQAFLEPGRPKFRKIIRDAFHKAGDVSSQLDIENDECFRGSFLHALGKRGIYVGLFSEDDFDIFAGDRGEYTAILDSFDGSTLAANGVLEGTSTFLTIRDKKNGLVALGAVHHKDGSFYISHGGALYKTYFDGTPEDRALVEGVAREEDKFENLERGREIEKLEGISKRTFGDFRRVLREDKPKEIGDAFGTGFGRNYKNPEFWEEHVKIYENLGAKGNDMAGGAIAVIRLATGERAEKLATNPDGSLARNERGDFYSVGLLPQYDFFLGTEPSIEGSFQEGVASLTGMLSEQRAQGMHYEGAPKRNERVAVPFLEPTVRFHTLIAPPTLFAKLYEKVYSDKLENSEHSGGSSGSHGAFLNMQYVLR